MSWEDQGRQQHGWFGSGKGEATNNDGAASDGQSLNQRMDAVVSGAIAALPRALRSSMELRLDTATRAQLSTLLVTWSRGAGLDRAQFAGQFFGRDANDPVATSLRTAALTAGLSGQPEALRDAAEHLASAMETVGPDRWYRFLDDSQSRADDPATVAALEKSQTRSDSPRDAIRPVYPLETAIGIAVSGIAGGAAAAGTALLRQLLPKRPPATVAKPIGAPPPPQPEPTLNIVAPGGRPVGTVFGWASAGIRTVTQAEFRTIQSRLLQGATSVKKAGYGVTWYKRLDGSEFGIRNSSKNGLTIDVNHPSISSDFKVHMK